MGYIFTARRNAEQGIVMASRPSVRLSVRDVIVIIVWVSSKTVTRV